ANHQVVPTQLQLARMLQRSEQPRRLHCPEDAERSKATDDVTDSSEPIDHRRLAKVYAIHATDSVRGSAAAIAPNQSSAPDRSASKGRSEETRGLRLTGSRRIFNTASIRSRSAVSRDPFPQTKTTSG